MIYTDLFFGFILGSFTTQLFIFIVRKRELKTMNKALDIYFTNKEKDKGL